VLVVVAAAFAALGAPAHAECLEAACEGRESPVTTLRAIVTPHHGRSYRHPGYSSVEVVSTPEAAYVTLSEPRAHVHLRWLTAERESNVVRLSWSCSRPRQTFRDVLTARAEVGATVTAEITFHAQLDARWCRMAKQREEAQRAAAKRRRESEQRAAQQRESEQHEAEQREAQQREATSTCTNGTYVNSAGNTVCKPEESSTVPAGATAECEDGTFSFSESRSGTCSHHGGVRSWL
jgi:hypothetical protein